MIDERIDAKLASIEEKQPSRKKKLAVIVSKGTLEAALFFTFFGLHILKKGAAESLRFVPLGNPATPMPMPNIISALPGMTALATIMMKQTIANKQIVSIPELLDLARESGVKLWPCQMTMDIMGIERKGLIDGLAKPVGAATFLSYAADADITLFI